MCSWGHVAKNSTACSHEWRSHSTIALVFSTKAWHGQKRSSSGHSHKCQGGVQSDTNTGWVNCKRHLRPRPHLDLPSEPSSSVWTLAGDMWTAKCVSWHPVFLFVAPAASMLVPWGLYLHAAMAFHAWVELQLSLWHKSSIWFHLTGAMNNLIGGIIISSQLH